MFYKPIIYDIGKMYVLKTYLQRVSLANTFLHNKIIIITINNTNPSKKLDCSGYKLQQV